MNYAKLKAELASLGKGALVAAAGAALTYAGAWASGAGVAEALGEWAPVAGMVLAVLVNAGRKAVQAWAGPAEGAPGEAPEGKDGRP